MEDSSAGDLSEIESFIDGMTLYESDYETIRTMIESMDDSLFLKVMEEIKDGRMSFSDFSRVISSEGYESLEGASFERQEKLYRKVVDLHGYLSGLGIINEGDRLGFLAANGSDMTFDESGNLGTETMERRERKNAVSDLIRNGTSGDPLEEFYENAVLRNILGSDLVSGRALDSLLLSAHEYLIPVDFDSIAITESDRGFMAENGIGEDEMKKIKSLAAFYAVRINDRNKKTA